MKALLIVLFAVFVTTLTASGHFKEETPTNFSEQRPEETLNERDDTSEVLELCSERSNGSFSLFDYSVVIAMLAVSLKIGLFYGYFHKSSSNSADNTQSSKMGLFPVTLSLTTSFVTAIELLGNPAEMYFYGTQFSLIGKQLL